MSVIKVRGEDGKFHSISVIKGEDGITPHIGDNGNWFIGETDTGVKAGGFSGLTEDDKNEIVNAVLAALPKWEGGTY